MSKKRKLSRIINDLQSYTQSYSAAIGGRQSYNLSDLTLLTLTSYLLTTLQGRSGSRLFSPQPCSLVLKAKLAYQVRLWRSRGCADADHVL